MSLDLMTSKEAAKLLNLSVIAVQRLAQKGKLPVFKMNQTVWRFDRKELLEWAKKGGGDLA